MSIQLLSVQDGESPGRYLLTLDVEGERVTTAAELGNENGGSTIEFSDQLFDHLLARYGWLVELLGQLLLNWGQGIRVELPHTLLPPEHLADAALQAGPDTEQTGAAIGRIPTKPAPRYAPIMLSMTRTNGVASHVRHFDTGRKDLDAQRVVAELADLRHRKTSRSIVVAAVATFAIALPVVLWIKLTPPSGNGRDERAPIASPGPQLEHSRVAMAAVQLDASVAEYEKNGYVVEARLRISNTAKREVTPFFVSWSISTLPKPGTTDLQPYKLFNEGSFSPLPVGHSSEISHPLPIVTTSPAAIIHVEVFFKDSKQGEECILDPAFHQNSPELPKDQQPHVCIRESGANKSACATPIRACEMEAAEAMVLLKK